jgi:hypothetical protein
VVLSRRLALAVPPLLLAMTSCSGSNTPVSPTPGTPTPVPVATTSGRVSDALTDAGAPGIAITGSDVVATRSDAEGNFSVGVSRSISAPLVGFAGTGFVARSTSVRVPGPAASVSLIPAAFDLRAFDEMFRVSQLLRWTEAPPVKIQTRTLQFTAVNDADFTALDDVMTDAEYAQLVADLQWALPQLTGGRYTAFAAVTRETAAAGDRVHILNTGIITVARYVGLTQATGFWGYSRWFFRGDGTITSGESMLDRDFERSGNQFLRSLRAHELGHTLGYNHVTVRASVMNSSARIEPNDFDRAAARIAFQRPPGNRSPDVDPDTFSTNRLHASGSWAPAVP